MSWTKPILTSSSVFLAWIAGMLTAHIHYVVCFILYVIAVAVAVYGSIKEDV